MNPIIKKDIIAQLEELPNDKLERLCDSLGVTDTDDFNLLSERLENDAFTASLNGISVKREVNMGSYLVENIDLLDANEAHEIIDKYIFMMDDKYSEEDDALVILYNYDKDDEEQEVIGVCDYIYRHVDSISSSDARQIIEEYFSPYRDILFDPSDEDIVIVD